MKAAAAIGVWTLLFLAGGCGTGQETGEHDTLAATTPPRADQPLPSIQLQTRTDTVDALRTTAHHDTAASTDTAYTAYSVQIGAFRDPANAGQIVARARERYHFPVLNDFFPRQGLYQIRIGMFATQEEAHAFRERMQKEFPEEYRDCWVVTLKP
jgi:cell division septation protein DedD